LDDSIGRGKAGGGSVGYLTDRIMHVWYVLTLAFLQLFNVDIAQASFSKDSHGYRCNGRANFFGVIFPAQGPTSAPIETLLLDAAFRG
jgi:hypothetical protein